MKLKKYVTKPTGKNWNLRLDTKYSVGSTPDPRDTTNEAVTDAELQSFALLRKETPGYTGWDREYVGEDQVVFTYYIDTHENAVAYLHNALMVIEAMKQADSALHDKFANPDYTIEWKLFDNSDQETPL